MTAAEKQELHAFLLKALRAAGDAGRPAARLLTDVRLLGFFDVTQPELTAELRELADVSWIAPMDGALGGTRYRLTALGASKLTEAGL